MEKRLICLLLLATFLKGLVWMTTVPLWHFPDEQAHFAQVALFSETGKMIMPDGKDLNKEIWHSEVLLGTERDWAGNNKFTFHPEYKVEYTNSTVGKYEEEIKNIPLSDRKIFIKHEAAGYPPLYYRIASLFYKLAYNSDLITRVFFVRFFSVIITVFTVFFSCLTAKEIFAKNSLWVIGIPLLVSFQPMFSFVCSGISSDNLMNLLYTIFIYLCLRVINKGIEIKEVIFLSSAIFLGFLTKKHFAIALPTLLFLPTTKRARNNIFYFFLLGILIFFLNGTLMGNYFKVKQLQLHWPEIGEKTVLETGFFEHLIWTLRHTIAEVLPWYWGVFKWLGVVLPRSVNRLLMRIMLFAFFGLIVKAILIIKRKEFTKENLNLAFLTWAAFIYFAVLMYWDWLFRRTHGFSFGIQGRYYFPAIVPHMVLLLAGVTGFIPESWRKARLLLIKIMTTGMIILNFIALWTVFNAYYDISGLNLLILETSQYKPWFLKGGYFIFIFASYLIALLFFLKNFLIQKKINHEKT